MKEIMADLKIAIPNLRESVVAILRTCLVKPETTLNGQIEPAQYEVGWGTGFCVVSDRYLITAFHVLSGDQKISRNPQSKFYALVVPGNGNPFYTFPVIGFPLERQDIDIAVLEIGPCSSAEIHLPPISVTFNPLDDGTQVLTTGFPAPEISGINMDANHNFQSGNFFLKSHANEGIISAQYVLNNNLPMYELNVGWHIGESGGPIATAVEQPVVFSLMQHYRTVQSPNGILPGPRRGISLSVIRQELEALGVVGVL